MAKKDANNDELQVPHTRKEARPDLSKFPEKAKLPDDLQKLIDRDETMYEALYDGTAPDSTESSLRYAAYATRIRTILLSAHRYVAYTSDVGESFRPVAHPWLIKGAYGVSWAYLAGDVAHEGYKAYWHNKKALNPTWNEEKKRWSAVDAAQSGPNATATSVASKADTITQDQQVVTKISPLEDYRTVMAQRAIFQGLASMGLPAFTIHSVVRYSGRALKDAKNVTIRTYAPIGLGLAVVPFLPYIFDEPVEKAVEWTFHKAFETFGADVSHSVGGSAVDKGSKEL
ncbi:MAG: hypothetical protein M1825_005698 [Sarcosagium campestre]|nr:MAG: hypothetical protein M1825_005698 [Sarcosagium campestre]